MTPVKDAVTITGSDAHHLAQVVRMQVGEQIRISTHEGESYLGEVDAIAKDTVSVRILKELPSTELPAKIYLFQALPKGDRMETVIEKAVELGVYEIIPVEMKYCVVKLDAKKKEKRIARYQAIAESAAKQSKRSVVPQIHDVLSYDEALSYAKQCDVQLAPYECKEGMAATSDALDQLSGAQSIAILIGPEGGFAEEEIKKASAQMDVISLGSRILRTDTAAITAMSMVMLALEMRDFS